MPGEFRGDQVTTPIIHNATSADTSGRKESENGFIELKDVAGGSTTVDAALQWLYTSKYTSAARPFTLGNVNLAIFADRFDFPDLCRWAKIECATQLTTCSLGTLFHVEEICQAIELVCATFPTAKALQEALIEAAIRNSRYLFVETQTSDLFVDTQISELFKTRARKFPDFLFGICAHKCREERQRMTEPRWDHKFEQFGLGNDNLVFL
jgi:hypothetical protein